MTNLLEKLGITPGPWMADRENIGPIEACAEFAGDYWIDCPDNDMNLVLAAPEMLEALIDQCIQLEDIGFIANLSEIDHPIKIIEKATGKSWEEIRRSIEND